MRGMLSAQNLRRTIRALAVVPIVAGTLTLVLGSAVIPDPGRPSASTESELHFYGVWWIATGLFLLSLVPRIEHRGRELRVVCGLLVLAAVGRVIAIADAGWPHWQFVVLMGLEFVLPPLLVLWQRRIAEP